MLTSMAGNPKELFGVLGPMRIPLHKDSNNDNAEHERNTLSISKT